MGLRGEELSLQVVYKFFSKIILSHLGGQNNNPIYSYELLELTRILRQTIKLDLCIKGFCMNKFIS